MISNRGVGIVFGSLILDFFKKNCNYLLFRVEIFRLF